MCYIILPSMFSLNRHFGFSITYNPMFSYVAVTGIPDYMEDHCCAMALFASQIVIEFDHVVGDLAKDEDSGGLGQDTATLRLRVGCHSGPVTAGVLRGDKGRFQLFGDTVNTAARMESNGQAGKVQISEQMANILAWEGKSHWYTPREDKIAAKGKGELQTYWLQDDLMGQYRRDRDQPQQQRKQHVASLWMHLDDVSNIQEQQLIEWNFQQLEILVKKIVSISMAYQNDIDVAVLDDGDGALHYEEPEGTILDELEIDANMTRNLIPACNMKNNNYESVVLSPEVVLELLAFVKAIATNFQNNPFHNFHHSCHMTRSMIKLMDKLIRGDSNGKACNALAQDPLAQFVVVLTCMVQDVDNPGVTNEQLMHEDSDMAEYFSKTCLQRKLLMYLLVRNCVYRVLVPLSGRLTLVFVSTLVVLYRTKCIRRCLGTAGGRDLRKSTPGDLFPFRLGAGSIPQIHGSRHDGDRPRRPCLDVDTLPAVEGG
jgi:Adenylate and Guanylate cyclase catalytic domain